MPGGAQVVFHPAEGQPPVGDHLIEAGHHLRLGHDRKPGKIGQLKPGRVNVRQPAGVERGALDRPGQHRPQPLGLVGGEPARVPAQPRQLGHQAGAVFGFHPGLQASQAWMLGRGHVALPAAAESSLAGRACHRISCEQLMR